jgi:hypothetical protein
MYDVGADFNNFTPIKWQDLKAIIKRQIAEQKNFIELVESDNTTINADTLC